MADVYDYQLSTGTIIPDTAILQTSVQDEFKQAFGQDLNLDPNTPEGLLISAETLSRKAVVDNNAQIANQINPNLSGGIFLDALCALTGLYRIGETFTKVTCTLTGVTGTVIPLGSQAQDTNGNLFQSIAEVTLSGMSGTATVVFEALVEGPITVSATDLNQIVSTIIGWETITNPAAQDSIGTFEESDAALRTRRKSTLAIQGVALPVAIISGLLNTEGVTSVSFLENIAPTTQVIEGVTMVGHSIYACVQGGSNEDVANTLVAKKSLGAAYNNGASSSPQSVEVTIPGSGQVMDILFDRPNIVVIQVRVTVVASSAIQDPTATVKQAILDYVAGNINGDPGLEIGTAVSPFELAGAVNIEAPGIFVTNCEIKKLADPDYEPVEIAIAIFELASISASGISVVF